MADPPSTPQAPSTAAKYDAFISYSHAADGALAPALQRALHAFARPWYRLRSLHVFRDETSLAANPALWPSIERALAASRWFIYLASPTAAASHWVQREVEWWLEHRGASSMLIVPTAGTLRWDDAAGDFDWAATDVLPRTLAGRFGTEPLWVDLAWASRAEVRSLRHAPFRAAVLRLSAAIQGRQPEELDGDDLRVFRRNRTIARAGVAALALLTVASVIAAYVAITQSRESMSRELAMYAVQQLDTDPELSLRLAMHAMESARTQQAEDALRRALGESQVLTTIPLGTQVTHVAYTALGRNVLLVGGRDVWLAGPGAPVRFAHPALVWSAELSGDNTLVATGAWDGKARVWDARDGRLVAEMQAGVPKSGAPANAWIVEEAHFNADATRLVTSGGDPASEDSKQARVWDARTGRLLATLVGHTQSVDAVAVSPDGSKVATGGWDRSVRIWNATTGALEHALAGHVAAISELRFSPDGRWLFSGSRDLTVRKWDARTGAAAAVVGRAASDAGLPVQTRLVVISPSTARALVHDATATTLYDLATGAMLRSLPDFPGACETAVFGPDDRLVACPGRDGVAFVWSADTGVRLATLRGHQGDINDLAIQPGNQQVLTAGSDGTARAWTLKPVAVDAVLQGHNASVDTAAWSADGQLAATASGDGTARVWDGRSGAPVSVITPKTATGRPALVRFVSFAADERLLVGSLNGGGGIWDPRSGTLVRELERVNHDVPDESLIDLDWGPRDAFLIGVVNSVRHLDTTPVGTSPIAQFNRAYRVFRWDAATGRIMAPMPAAAPLEKSPQQRCGYSRTSGTYCLGIGDGVPLHLLDLGTGAELTQVMPTLESSFMGALSDDGRLMALSDQVKVEIWDARTGRKQTEFVPGESQFVTGVAFDSTGTRLITGGGQATPIARIWDAATGRMLRELRGHTHGVTMARFSPDGRLAVTASEDTTARVWRVDDGQAIATLRGHRDMVMGAWFSPDNGRVLTSSSDGTARIFDMSLTGSAENLLDLAARRQTRFLTAQERERFLH
jgi:WD40 repeat protein